MLHILVIALLGLSLSQTPKYPLNETFPINSSSTVPTFLFLANVANMSRLEVNSTPASQLILCFQEQYLFQEPTYNNHSVYWSKQGICSIFVSANGYHVEELPILNVPYVVGVSFLNTSAPAITEVVLKIGMTGDSCPNNEVSINQTTQGCVAPMTINVNTVVHVKADEMNVYHFQLSSSTVTGEFMIDCPDNTSKVDFRLKRDGSPSASNAMVLSCPAGHMSNVPNPRNGLRGYYLMVHNHENHTVNFTVKTTECTNQTGGPGCKIGIMNASTNPTLMLLQTDIYYFKVNATVNNPVWVNVRRVNSTFTNVVNPLIFASMNQIPSVGNADIGGCNQFYCDYVNVIKFNVSENQTWYIGIQNSDALLYNGSTAGIWFNSVCAPECQDHGTCADSGPQMGFCDCIDGFIGVDCQTQNGFGPQFIVLIIIAVLVALTAVIGFGAWAYMRRKRGQYDLVT